MGWFARCVWKLPWKPRSHTKQGFRSRKFARKLTRFLKNTHICTRPKPLNRPKLFFDRFLCGFFFNSVFFLSLAKLSVASGDNFLWLFFFSGMLHLFLAEPKCQHGPFLR